jgi:hypothetical protein
MEAVIRMCILQQRPQTNELGYFQATSLYT